MPGHNRILAPLFASRNSAMLALLASLWLVVFLLTRLVLAGASINEWLGEASLAHIASILLHGMAFDIAFLAYAALPASLLLLLVPDSWWHKGILPASLFLMLFVAASEWFFWDEFGARFNFIAVDYLVYSDEVISNIRESYPLPAILVGLALLAIIVTALLQPLLRRHVNSRAPLNGWRQRLAMPLATLVPALLCFVIASQDELPDSRNNYLHELGSNGPYQFFAAFRNNTLDYGQFYAGLPDSDIRPLLQAELGKDENTPAANAALDIHRFIDNPGMPQHHNVVLVTIESLSARYLGSFGDTRGLTPNLDELRRHSLFFNNFYATGTRTDRGLEAVTLSVPPTPGRSIVKRIGHESGYGALGQQLRAQGYDSVFVYGGRGYFDNMNAFFSGNGYRIVDQSSVPDSEIHFKNAWGMADEDLYAQAIKVADADHRQQQPFFLHIMTTSNHRPYTYPEGRIDIPSGAGREGAVKYTDYAVGQFLAAARSKPWFNDTIFVFLADHCAGSAGKEDLPVANYHIPLFVYAPGIVQPRESAQLASQIDVAPTVMGLLNLDYNSSFFGRDLLQADNGMPPRVLVGNYQHLGLFDGKDLAILSPGLRIRKHLDALGSSIETPASLEDPLVQRTIAYYEAASIGYKQHLLGWQPPAMNPHAHIAGIQDTQQESRHAL